MASHRVTDLAVGHPGLGTYDLEEQEWKFSQTLTDGPFIKQLLPIKGLVPPSNRISFEAEKASLAISNQARWLSKTLPEAFPAKSIVSSLARGSWDASSELSSELGSILAIGYAHDPERLSGVRRPQIIAMPYGAAGHVLRLIKPRVETRGWGKSSGARLSFLNVDTLDAGHWIGTGGTIRQIVTAGGENDKESWLAVRQATVVTLFLPIYGKIHTNPVSTGYSTFAPSILNANPVVSLTAQRTGSKSHSDVAFNPWFSGQVAVVDTVGYWSIWEVDSRYNHGNKASEILIPKKTGGFHECWAKDEFSKAPGQGHLDGWYRILWSSNLTTIVICNRRHIRIFDVKAQPTPLGQVDIFPAGNTDWILDIQRSTTDMNCLYVLTTTRIFWIEITPVGERNNDPIKPGGRIILSHFHFMSPDDESLKLAPLTSDNVSVSIISAKNRVFNYYAFLKAQPGCQVSSKGTFSIPLLCSGDNKGRTLPLHNVIFLPCQLTLSANHVSGPGPKYVEDGVEFFQLWAVTNDLGLLSTLSAVAHPDTATPEIVAPDTKLLLSSRFLGPKFVNEDDDFVVPDDKYSEIAHRSKTSHAGRTRALPLEKDDLRFRLNWRIIFQKVFLEDPSNEERQRPNVESEPIPEFPELLNLAANDIMQRKELEEAMNVTLAEMVGVTNQGEDLEQASPALRAFLGSLERDQVLEDRWRLVVRDLTLGTEIFFPANKSSMPPELLSIFDQLVDYWMTSLPVDLPNLVRHTKFKAMRRLAMDLCLNSIGVSLRDRALETSGEAVPRDEETVEAFGLSKDGEFTRESSPNMFSSQLVAIPGLTLPIPNETPSLYSQATSASGLVEDPVIARLRQYAPTIKAKQDLTTTAHGSIRSHWHSAKADPHQYSYKAAKQAWAAANTDWEDARSTKNEKARRRRRTENFIKAVEPAVSQRLTLAAGSQPEILGNMFSSQPISELPLTQPESGTFGSRTVRPAKKRAKKPRTDGFK